MNKIGVVGLGRLGLCLALNLENVGYEVWGYDISKQRLNDIKNKKVITTEPGVSLLLERQKNLHVTDYCRDVLHECDIVFVVIATPSKEDGKYNHDYINNFIDTELISLGRVNKKHLIINSTVMPGYSDLLHNKIKDLGWHVSYNPEFIAQGSIIYDQQHPDMILIGARNEEAGNIIEDVYSKLCINKPVFCKMTALEAEITKIGLNCFLATKISYANMIGDICKKVGADEVKVLNAIGSDTRVGNKYLKWGYGYGGECTLPNQLVQTSEGLKQIQHIKVGDLVLTHKGRFKPVTDIFIRPYEGMMNILKISGFNSELFLTPEHPVYSSKSSFNQKNRRFNYIDGKTQKIKERASTISSISEEEFFNISELQKGDYCSIPSINLESFILPKLILKNKFKTREIEINEDIIKFFGLYLSEGNIDRNQKNKFRVCFAFHKKEVYFQNFIIDVAKKYFNRTAKLTKKKGNGVVVRFNDHHLGKWLLNTFGHGSSNKIIPTSWLGLDDKLVNSLIEGIWLGDGSISDNHFTLGITSRQMSNFNILWMLKNKIAFNFKKVKSQIRNDGIRRKECYYLHVSNPFYINKMSSLFKDMKLERENAILKRTNWFRNENLLCRINNIDTTYYSGEVYNLEVEEDHSYMLENCVVHNCIPRDHRALGIFAVENGITDIISKATDMYNDLHLEYQLDQFLSDYKKKSVIRLEDGVAFKKGTDILTESQQLKFALKLIKQGYTVEIVDRKEVLEQVEKLYPTMFILTERN